MCKHLSQLPVDAYLPDMLQGLIDEQRGSMLVDNYCNRAARWPMRWLPTLTQTFSLNGWIVRPGVVRCTALHLAVNRGNQPTVEALIALGADVRITDTMGRSPLWTNSESGTRRLAEVLIEGGADLNAACRMDRSSPLLLAVYHRQDAVAYALIAAGADVNAPDFTPDEQYKARTPLWYAFEKEHDKPGGQALIDALSAAAAGEQTRTSRSRHLSRVASACQSQIQRTSSEKGLPAPSRTVKSARALARVSVCKVQSLASSSPLSTLSARHRLFRVSCRSKRHMHIYCIMSRHTGTQPI